MVINMKKILFFSILSLCFLLSSCDKERLEDNEATDLPNSQTENITTQTETDDSESYLLMLEKVVGNEYCRSKSFMQVDDEVINNQSCAVFKAGTNDEEHFATEDWFAITQTGFVYWLDIVKNEWISYDEAFKTSSLLFTTEDVDVCIYVLNDYVRDKFCAEYLDMREEIKQSIFEDEIATDLIFPAKLIGVYDEIPDGYYADPLARIYYPVYNFDSLDNIVDHFSDFFTENAMEEIKVTLVSSFYENEDTLYLVRGGMGSGSVTINFDTVDYSRLADEGIVVVDRMLFDEKDGQYELEFIYEDNKLKIDKITQH